MKMIKKIRRFMQSRRRGRFITVIESPYAGSNSMNSMEHVTYALKCARHSYEKGETPFASHLLYPRFMNDGIKQERADGIGFGFMIGDMLAERAAVYVDNGISAGMARAIEHWKSVGVEVEFRSLEK